MISESHAGSWPPRREEAAQKMPPVFIQSSQGKSLSLRKDTTFLTFHVSAAEHFLASIARDKRRSASHLGSLLL